MPAAEAKRLCAGDMCAGETGGFRERGGCASMRVRRSHGKTSVWRLLSSFSSFIGHLAAFCMPVFQKRRHGAGGKEAAKEAAAKKPSAAGGPDASSGLKNGGEEWVFFTPLFQKKFCSSSFYLPGSPFLTWSVPVCRRCCCTPTPSSAFSACFFPGPSACGYAGCTARGAVVALSF